MNTKPIDVFGFWVLVPKNQALKIALLLFILRGAFFAQAQTATPLDNYIKEGLANNASLKTQNFDLEKAVVALEQAKTLFMPQVNFQFQYTLAAGGRTTSLPIGDLLNGVYSTLNRLTQSNNFPSVENQSINFLPNNFQDTKLHTVYPILNREIFYNREIRKELITIEQTKINVFKRELVKNIKLAYFQYWQATEAVQIYRNALGLVNENLRVNEKLVKNEVATNAAILKAKNEVAKVENSIVEAENAAKNAAAYLNFLLNRALDAPILNEKSTPPTPQYPPVSTTDFLQKREEIVQIGDAQRVNALQKQLAEAYRTPKIGASLDVGFQGFGFKIWDKQAYFLLGASLELPIYTAGGNKLKVEQARLDGARLDAQRTEVAQQIALQIQVARTNLETADRALAVNAAELASAREYYRLTERRYREGQALQIELTDARTQLTAAELKQNVAKFTILLRGVELERATASYAF